MVYFPLNAERSTPLEHEPTIPAPRERRDTDALVLIVEDNPQVAHLITSILGTTYRIATAANGQESLEKALTLEPDLILCDVKMPGMSGDRFVYEVRAHPELDLVPLIVLSTRADDQLHIPLLRGGAQDFLLQPFSPEELRARAANLITIKQVRQVLQQEVTRQDQNLVDLASEVVACKRKSERMVLILQENETDFHFLADTMPQILWTARPDGGLDYYNQRWFDYTGLTYEQTRGWGWGHVIHPDDLQKCSDTWTSAIQTGETYEIEYRFKRASDGVYRWHLGRALPVRDSSGKIIKWLGTSTDIDEQKRIEEALRESEERKDLFLSMAGHELKSPITSLKIFTQVLHEMLQQEGKQEPAGYLAKMDIQINKLTRLITGLLDVSRVNMGKLALNEEYFDSDAFVRGIVETIQPTSPKHTINIIGTISQQFYGDKDRLGQVLINLLTNAIKYSPAASSIDVIVTTHQGWVTVAVRDRGIGIPEEHRSHIFERFYRVYSDKDKKYPGLGIGLYIAFEIIQRHGGRMWVESTEGGGSTFSFSVPLPSKKEANRR